jgi:hypothetical protein
MTEDLRPAAGVARRRATRPHRGWCPTATALRVVTLASNEGLTYSRVVELEAYAS